MAENLGISLSTYNKIEKLETKLTVERLFQIQEVLESNLEDLLNLKAENIYNQDLKDNSVGHQEIQNLYQDTKEINQQFVSSLQAEIEFLRKIALERKNEQ